MYGLEGSIVCPLGLLPLTFLLTHAANHRHCDKHRNRIFNAERKM